MHLVLGDNLHKLIFYGIYEVCIYYVQVHIIIDYIVFSYPTVQNCTLPYKA